jgi:hypothetical protein
MIETGEGVVDEARGSSVDEVGALGVFKNLLEGTFHCNVWGRNEGKVVDSREDGQLINELEIKAWML